MAVEDIHRKETAMFRKLWIALLAPFFGLCIAGCEVEERPGRTDVEIEDRTPDLDVDVDDTDDTPDVDVDVDRDGGRLDIKD
jgi:hypothetical protein